MVIINLYTFSFPENMLSRRHVKVDSINFETIMNYMRSDIERVKEKV